MNQINIVRITLQESGTYNRQFSRPYEVVTTNDRMSALNMLEDRIGNVTRANPIAKIEGNLLSGLCSNLVVPAAAYDRELMIPNGWNEQRLRFVIEVHIQSHFGTDVYFMQGFTDYAGVSLQGSIDPKMTFFINSFIKVNRSQDLSGMNPMGYRDVITEAYQVVNGQFHSQQGNHQVYGLRPEDVIVGIQSNYLSGMASSYTGANIADVRVNKAGESLRSRRSNGIPSNFLGRLVESYRTASTLADFGNGTDDIYSRAVQNCYEGTVYENPFIRAISNIKQVPNASFFCMEDLVKIDPTVAERTVFHRLMETVRMHRIGDTDDNWIQPRLETQLATITTHAVAGLMIDNMLVYVNMHSTTLTLNGMPETRISPDIQGVTTADMRPYVGKFVNRFETEVLPDLTMNWSLSIDLRITANLYGETTIDVSIDGQPHERFVTPSFCDSLMVPVVTTNTNDYHSLVTGIEEVMNHCGTASASMATAMNGSVIDTNI